jgi:hypothetical protein
MLRQMAKFLVVAVVLSVATALAPTPVRSEIEPSTGESKVQGQCVDGSCGGNCYCSSRPYDVCNGVDDFTCFCPAGPA